MPHPDADDLALLALGESLGSTVDAHIAGCAACTAEIESFRETVELAELSNFGENAPRPGEHVWAAIASELGFTGTRESAGAVPTAGAVATAVPESGPVADTGPIPPTSENDESTTASGSSPHLRAVPGTGTTRASISPGPSTRSSTPPPRRWSRWAAPLAAAVVGIAVGAGAVIVSQNRANDVTLEATAPLTPVPGGPLAADQQEQLGKAELVAAATGQEVRVTAADLPPSNDSYEVWLFGDDGRMVSLGTLSDGSGSFTVPAGINTQEYRVVDVSDEPPDGNPLHSGISLIRGAFS